MLTALASASPTISPSLDQAYATALETYLTLASDEALADAYELGRRALAEQLSLIELIDIHETAVLRLLSAARPTTDSLPQSMLAARRFLLQSTAPFVALQRNCQENLEALRRLNVILDGEARRIAQSLHDDVFQLFATAYLELAAIRSTASESLQVRIDKVTSQLDLTREQLRQLSHELRAPVLDRYGLVAALKFLVRSFRQRTGLDVTARLPDQHQRFSDCIETATYRIAQEALTNISRHANVDTAELELSITEHSLALVVSDCGAGFDASRLQHAPEEAGLGVAGMRERANLLGGTLILESTPGQGTEIRMTVPL